MRGLREPSTSILWSSLILAVCTGCGARPTPQSPRAFSTTSLADGDRPASSHQVDQSSNTEAVQESEAPNSCEGNTELMENFLEAWDNYLDRLTEVSRDWTGVSCARILGEMPQLEQTIDMVFLRYRAIADTLVCECREQFRAEVSRDPRSARLLVVYPPPLDWIAPELQRCVSSSEFAVGIRRYVVSPVDVGDRAGRPSTLCVNSPDAHR